MTPCRVWQIKYPKRPPSYDRSNRYGLHYDPVTKRIRPVHIWVWEQVNGPIPPGMEVCHKCDNPPCYRYDHLFLGTHAENMADMAAKGRTQPNKPRGEVVKTSKLTTDQVLAIRASPLSLRAAAREFGVSKSLVSVIRRGEAWAHIESYERSGR